MTSTSDLQSPRYRSPSSCFRFLPCARLQLSLYRFQPQQQSWCVPSGAAHSPALPALGSVARGGERGFGPQEQLRHKSKVGLLGSRRSAPGGRPLGTPAPWAVRGGARRRAGLGLERWRGLWLSRCPHGSGCAAPLLPPPRGRPRPGEGRNRLHFPLAGLGGGGSRAGAGVRALGWGAGRRHSHRPLCAAPPRSSGARPGVEAAMATLSVLPTHPFCSALPSAPRHL